MCEYVYQSIRKRGQVPTLACQSMWLYCGISISLVGIEALSAASMG